MPIPVIIKVNERNSKKRDGAVAQDIATFTKMGYDVLIPITESASYDLVVDTGKNIKRVQIKFSSQKDVDLRRIHSNSKGYVVKKPKKNSYDWLYILKNDGKEYLLKECLNDRRSVSPQIKHLIVNRKW